MANEAAKATPSNLMKIPCPICGEYNPPSSEGCCVNCQSEAVKATRLLFDMAGPDYFKFLTKGYSAAFYLPLPPPADKFISTDKFILSNRGVNVGLMWGKKEYLAGVQAGLLSMKMHQQPQLETDRVNVWPLALVVGDETMPAVITIMLLRSGRSVMAARHLEETTPVQMRKRFLKLHSAARTFLLKAFEPGKIVAYHEVIGASNEEMIEALRGRLDISRDTAKRRIKEFAS